MNFNSGHQDIRRSLYADSLDCKVTNSFFHAPAVAHHQPYDTEIEPTDVLCGRGKTSFNHVGNRRFRDLIAAHTDQYNHAKSRLEKSMVVHSIVQEVKKIKGRFLKQDRYSGRWYELDERQAKEKVGHAIRDATSSIDPTKKTIKKTLSKSSSSSSSTSPSKDIMMVKPQKNLSDSSSDMDESSSSVIMVQTTNKTLLTDDSWDDLEPIHVDSLEAQNSLSTLQNDDFFLRQMSAVLGPSTATTTSAVTETAKKSTRYQHFRLEIM